VRDFGKTWHNWVVNSIGSLYSSWSKTVRDMPTLLNTPMKRTSIIRPVPDRDQKLGSVRRQAWIIWIQCCWMIYSQNKGII
jgi:hypothetical protein